MILPVVSSNVTSSSYVQLVQKGSNINITPKKACFKTPSIKAFENSCYCSILERIAMEECVPEKLLKEMKEAMVWKAEGEAWVPIGSWSNKAFLTQVSAVSLLLHFCPPSCPKWVGTCQNLADNFSILGPNSTPHIQSSEYFFFFCRKNTF